MLRRLAGGPVDTVLAVELGGKRPTRQTSILSVLCEPGCVFAVSIKAEAQSRMANNVMDGAEPVVRSAGLTSEHRMAPIATSRGADHLKVMLRADGVYELLRAGIRSLTGGERDSNARRVVRVCDLCK